jgi:hypothetical protein
LSLPGGNSTILRAVYVVGGLLVLLVIFMIIKGVLSGGSNLTLFVGIAQDQQEIVHLTTITSQQQAQGQTLTTSDQNFAATSQLSLSSAQTAIIQYLANNRQKVKAKTLNLKLSAATDTQLANAATAGNYDQVFQQVLKIKLMAYINDLRQTYKQTNGQKGHALLSDQYKQAQLLLVQLTNPSAD